MKDGVLDNISRETISSSFLSEILPGDASRNGGGASSPLLRGNCLMERFGYERRVPIHRRKSGAAAGGAHSEVALRAFSLSLSRSMIINLYVHPSWIDFFNNCGSYQGILLCIFNLCICV